jgi:hypothetical protein
MNTFADSIKKTVPFVKPFAVYALAFIFCHIVASNTFSNPQGSDPATKPSRVLSSGSPEESDKSLFAGIIHANPQGG